MPRPLSLAVAAVLALAAGTARAEPTCTNDVGGSADLDAVAPSDRRRFLLTNLDDEAGRARLWTWGWIGLGAAGTAVNGVLAATGDYDRRVDSLGAASGTLLLTATTIASPLRVPIDAREDDASDACDAVRRAERVLAHVARDEADRQTLAMHLLPIGGSIAGGVVLGAGYGHWEGGAINAGIGIVVAEIKMLTQPTGAERALSRYRAGALGPERPGTAWNLTPIAGQGARGLLLSVVF